GYTASFIGFAPAANPQVAVGVVLDDPTPIWGGSTAAPTFKIVMQNALQRLGIGPGPVLPMRGGAFLPPGGTPLPRPARSGDVPVPQLVVGGARAAMTLLAGPFFGHPSRSLTLAGVTGTNGKTTTTYMLDAIFAAAGATTGLIGTVETRFAGAATPGSRTTPESADLQRLLRRMVDAGVGFCAMEVTSVGLTQGRVEGAAF